MLIILKLAIIFENKKVNCSRKTDRDRLFTTKQKKEQLLTAKQTKPIPRLHGVVSRSLSHAFDRIVTMATNNNQKKKKQN